MLRENACSVPRRLRLASGGATSPAGTTGNILPHDEVRRLLRNWARWAADCFPDLGVQPPPWAAEWLPHKNWDNGWGDPIPLDPPSDPVDERAAESLDRLLMRLPTIHLLVIKRHYINHRKQEREALDAACRALGDLLA